MMRLGEVGSNARARSADAFAKLSTSAPEQEPRIANAVWQSATPAWASAYPSRPQIARSK